MVGRQKNTEIMRQRAVEAVNKGHAFHATKTYYWKGPERGWEPSDTVEQRKAL
jgi:hypothetical protein